GLKGTDASVTLIEGDLQRADTITGLEGADYVFHLAATVNAPTEAQFHAINQQGTANLLAAVERARPPLKRFVMVSSLAAAGPSGTDRPLDETAVPQPVSHYGASKLGAEEVAWKSHGAGLPVTVLRPAAVIGAGAKGFVKFVLRLTQLRIGLTF